MRQNESLADNEAGVNPKRKYSGDHDDDVITWADIVRGTKNWFRYLLRNWIILGVAVVAGALLGISAAWLSSANYSAKMTFVLEEGASRSSGLSVLAGQFGLDLGGMSGASSNMLAGDNIIGLLKSKRFTEEVLLTAYTPDNKVSLADKYAELYGLRKAWAKNKEIGYEVFFPVQQDRHGFSRIQNTLLQQMRDQILAGVVVARSDKRMSFFEVKTQFKDELLAKYFTERLVDKALDFYVETRTQRVRANVDRLQRRADSIGGLLNRRTYATASAQSRLLDINPAYQTANVAAEVTGRDKVMVATIYGEIIKNLEVQKATLTQETPVIQVVDAVELPLVKSKRSIPLYGLLFAFGAFCITAVTLLIKRAWK